MQSKRLMKINLILTFLITLCGSLSAQELQDSAQIDKKYFIGGSLSFSNSSGNNESGYYSISNSGFSRVYFGGSEYSNFAFSPYLGNQVSKNWAFGVGFNYLYSKRTGLSSSVSFQNFDYNQVRKTSNLFIFSRYSSSNILSVFTEPTLSVGWVNRSIDIINSNIEAPNDINTVEGLFSTRFGLQYNLNQRFRILAYLGDFTITVGRHLDTDEEFEDAYNSMQLNFGIKSFRLGGEFQF